jgi:hypothetical protein
MTKPNVATPVLVPLFLRGKFLEIGVCFVWMIGASFAVWTLSGVGPLAMLDAVYSAGRHAASSGDGVLKAVVENGAQKSVAAPGIAITVISIQTLLTFCIRHRSWIDSFAIASVAARFWTYHGTYDNIVLVFLLVAVALRFQGDPSRQNILAFGLVAVSLWTPARLWSIPLSDLVQSTIWMLATFLLFGQAIDQIASSQTVDSRITTE